VQLTNSSGVNKAMQGLFISFEGIDGAGKSSHIEALAQAFRANGRNVTLSREPGGTPLAEKIRALVLNDSMDPLTEALLMFAARRDHVLTVIVPALARGDVLLCDRFTDSSFAYQGGGRAFDTAVLATLEQWVQGDQSDSSSPLQPDLTVWFDLAPAQAARRLQASRKPDNFESQSLEFFTRVAQGYAQRLQQDPQRFARINADQIRESVWHDVKAVFVAKRWLS
jgi:dTMP kinase